MTQTILITGGSGLIGKPLTRFLLQQGHTIHHLSRHPEPHGNPRIKIFGWDVYKKQIDENCIKGVDTIIHLAGEGIAEKRWTEKRKKQIIESRTNSIRMIYGLLVKQQNHQVKTLISASATGFYGDRNDELLTENSVPGNDFLARTCIEWEKAADEGVDHGLRVVKFRTGFVLAEEGGALHEMAKPIKAGFGSALGNGKQWVPWIHLLDILRLYAFAIEKETIEGVFNTVAPNPVSNKQLTQEIASVLHQKIWMPNAPAFALKLLMGEMSILVLASAKVSSEKIQSEGFKFEYENVGDALKNIFSQD